MLFRTHYGALFLLAYFAKSCPATIGNEFCISDYLIERYQFNREIFQDCNNTDGRTLKRLPRRVDPIFRGKPKPRSEILSKNFHLNAYNFDQTNSLVTLINKIAIEYLAKCPPVIYYDRFVEESDGLILQHLFKTLPITFYHGEINENYKATNLRLKQRIDTHCKSFILFLSDPSMTRKIIGPQIESRVVLIARSTQWKLRDFLSSEKSSNIVNLLVIGESYAAESKRVRPYVLYTHELYTDGLGSNRPVVLTSWIRGGLSRPHINLFPPKFQNGFSGHRFLVSAVNQPPFIFSIKHLASGGVINTNWDGIEYRLMNLFAKKLNFSIELTEPVIRSDTKGIVEAIQWQISNKYADIGMSGIYITDDRLRNTDMSVGHSRDCAAFITLASKALPKYRAIMGPFQWPVWVALTFVYLGAIFPIAYTDRLTLSHLLGNWGEIENMFWYVFGMFTNSLTFSGKYSWSNSKKLSTRILIGSYWFFTIIVTACYTGSIIAFVTLPAFPDTVDSATDLLGLFFRVGTLDKNGWENWFQNSTHEPTEKLYKKMEFVSSLEEGIGNVTLSFFWNYAFLGSKAQLKYLVQSNFSDDNISRRSALHLSEECFALFQIGYMFPRDAVYKQKINSMILLAQQSGLINKIENEVSWSMQRSSTGKLLQASSGNTLRVRMQEERQLTTADTEGMFLLMGIGYAMGAVALISEIVGGITNKCRQIIGRSRRSISSSWSSRQSSSTNSREKRQRTEYEQNLHDRRKDARRAQIEAEKHGRFGLRQFNLTKATLKEIYGNYNKPAPDSNFVIKDGKLIVESEVLTTDTSNESRESSTDLLIPPLCIKKKSMILAEIDNSSLNNPSSDEPTEADIQSSLATLEHCIAEHDREEQLLDEEEIIFGKIEDLEQDVFGSYVQRHDNDLINVNHLQMFKTLNNDDHDHRKEIPFKVKKI